MADVLDMISLHQIKERACAFLLDPLNTEGLELYPSHPLHRVFSMELAPEWIVKLHVQSPRAMMKRKRNQAYAFYLCEKEGWDRLTVPWGIDQILTLPDGREWVIWIEKRLPLYPLQAYEEWYFRNLDAFLPVLQQWTSLLFLSDCTDVDWRNFPLLNDTKRMALIDLDGCELEEGMWASRAITHRTALLGNHCGSRGLLACIHPHHIPIVLDWARPALTNLYDFFPEQHDVFLDRVEQIQQERKAADHLFRHLDQWHQNQGIITGNEPVGADSSFSFGSLYDGPRGSCWRLWAERLLMTINQSITSSLLPQEARQSRRRVHVSTTTDSLWHDIDTTHLVHGECCITTLCKEFQRRGWIHSYQALSSNEWWIQA